jgi:hypothetical protein
MRTIGSGYFTFLTHTAVITMQPLKAKKHFSTYSVSYLGKHHHPSEFRDVRVIATSAAKALETALDETGFTAPGPYLVETERGIPFNFEICKDSRRPKSIYD